MTVVEQPSHPRFAALPVSPIKRHGTVPKHPEAHSHGGPSRYGRFWCSHGAAGLTASRAAEVVILALDMTIKRPRGVGRWHCRTVMLLVAVGAVGDSVGYWVGACETELHEAGG